jgi:hypothetical protein
LTTLLCDANNQWLRYGLLKKKHMSFLSSEGKNLWNVVLLTFDVISKCLPTTVTPPTTVCRSLAGRPSPRLSPILSLLARNKADHLERESNKGYVLHVKPSFLYARNEAPKDWRKKLYSTPIDLTIKKWKRERLNSRIQSFFPPAALFLQSGIVWRATREGKLYHGEMPKVDTKGMTSCTLLNTSVPALQICSPALKTKNRHLISPHPTAASIPGPIL